MIVYADKKYETNSLFPDSNFSDVEDVFIVDETTEEGTALAHRIMSAYPYYDFVIKDGKLVDIVELPKPEPEPEPLPAPEPSLEELCAQQLAQAEAIAAIFEMLTGGEA